MQSRTNFYKLSGAIVVVLLMIAGTWGQAHATQLQATPPSVPASSPSGRFYVVQVGDSLFSIAARYNVSISELATINRVYDVNSVYVGQVLALPNMLPAGGIQNLPGTTQQQVPAVNPVTIVSSPTTTIFTPPVITFPAGTTITTVTSYSSYVVRPGDFLSSIASQFNTTPSAILSANAINDPNLLYVGQLLTIPHVTTKTVVPVVRQVVVPAASGRVYIVQPGDNLFSIGARTGRSAWAIAQANGLLDLNNIYVGEPLVLP